MSAISYNTFQRDFTVGRTIGKGCSSEVKEVYSTKENTTYALKIMICQNSDKMAEALNQMETIVAIDDDAMPKIYYYYIRQIPSQSKSNRLVKQMAFVMELCNGDLNGEIQQIKANQKPSYTTEEITCFIHNFIKLFSKMQRKKYLHRDIKPQNILVKQEGQSKTYKLADFGYAIKLNTYSASTISGTQQYVSPRVLKKFKDTKLTIEGNNFKDDMYSLGITVIEMIFLRVEAADSKTYSIIQTLHGKYVKKLIQLMTQHEQKDRPDFVQLQDLIQKEKQKARHQDQNFKSYFKKINKPYNSLQQIHVKQEDLKPEHLYQSNLISKNQPAKTNQNLYRNYETSLKTKKKVDFGSLQDAQIQTQQKQTSNSKAANYQKNSLKRIHLDQTVYHQDHSQKHISQLHISLPLQHQKQFPKTIKTLKVQKVQIKDEQIYCVRICKDMILFGLTGYIGVALKQNPHKYCKVEMQRSDPLSKRPSFIVTGIKIQQDLIVVFGTSKIIFMINVETFQGFVKQFMQSMPYQPIKMENKRNKLCKSFLTFKKQNQAQTKSNKIILKGSPFRLYHCRQTVSCVDFVKVKDPQSGAQNHCDSQQTFIILGHYSGQISQYGQMNLIKMDTSPITQIKVFELYLYVSTAKGKLKKYLLENLRNYENIKLFQQKVQSYNYNHPIVSFSFMIQSQKTISKTFKTFQGKKGKPFIKLITYDGYLHILNEKLTLLSWIMIGDTGIFAISQRNFIWQSEYLNEPEGQIVQTNIFKTKDSKTYILNLNGNIYDQQGSLVVHSSIQKANCFDLSEQIVACGSFQGQLAVIKPQTKSYNPKQGCSFRVQQINQQPFFFKKQQFPQFQSQKSKDMHEKKKVKQSRYISQFSLQKFFLQDKQVFRYQSSTVGESILHNTVSQSSLKVHTYDSQYYSGFPKAAANLFEQNSSFYDRIQTQKGSQIYSRIKINPNKSIEKRGNNIIE